MPYEQPAQELIRSPHWWPSQVEKVRSTTAYAGVGEALARKVALPLLLDLGCQLLLAHLASPGLALGPDELFLLVEALDQPPTPFFPGEFLRVAHAEPPLYGRGTAAPHPYR